MNRKNLTEYLKNGFIMNSSPKIYRSLIYGSGGWSLIGLIYGIILKKYWILISLFMVLAFFAAITIVIVLSFGKLTIKKRIIIQTIINLSWVLQISLMEIIIFTMTYGWCVWLLLLFLPTIVIPLSLGIIIHIRLKKDSYISKKITNSSFALVGAMTGLIGMNFGAIFRNIEQSEAIILTLIIMLLINGIFSIGLVDIQKLYYLFKYEKVFVFLEDSFEKTVDNSQNDTVDG